MLTAVSGINWGDEGKSKMVDMLSNDYDVVVRFQGGNNVGHTVVNEKGKFILNLIPSGILRENVVNVMGNGMVIDIKHLCEEIERLRNAGIVITPDNLKISDRAVICMPYSVMQDRLEDERLAYKKHTSTKKGIVPAFSDKFLKKAIKMGDLLNMSVLANKLETILESKNLLFGSVYDAKSYTLKDLLHYVETYGKPLIPYLINSTAFLTKMHNDGKKILLEAQLGALRDIDFGIYPYTTAFHTIASYAPIGAGVPNIKLDLSIGIMKAYSTCVGAGPFTAEYFGKKAEELRDAGGEYNVFGKPGRVGPFDVVASKYGVMVQGADQVALTKLDVLSYLDEIEVCVAYELDGKQVTELPYPNDLDRCKPIFKTLKGWKCDISKCRKYEDLPIEAKEYIEFIKQETGANVKYISVGAGREEYIVV